MTSLSENRIKYRIKRPKFIPKETEKKISIFDKDAPDIKSARELVEKYELKISRILKRNRRISSRRLKRKSSRPHTTIPKKTKKFKSRKRKKAKEESDVYEDVKWTRSGQMFKEYLIRTNCEVPDFLKEIKIDKSVVDKLKRRGSSIFKKK